MPKILGLPDVLFQTIPLYILLDQFITVQVNLTMPYHWGTLNFMLISNNLRLNLLNILILWTLRVIPGVQHTVPNTICNIFKLRVVKVNPKRNEYIVIPSICGLSKHIIYHLIYQHFDYVSISRSWKMVKKALMNCPTTNLANLEEPWLVCLLTEVTKICIVTNIDVSKFAPWFVLQMDFLFLNAENIGVFKSTYVDICSATSHPFEFSHRIKLPPIDMQYTV